MERRLLGSMTSTIQHHQLSLDTRPIKEYALNLSEGRKVSNVGGFQSTKFTEPPEVCKELFAEVEQHLPRKMVLSTLWFNINGKDHYNIKHNHADKKMYMVNYGGEWIPVSHSHGLSGVYYVDVPDVNMGDIVFGSGERLSPQTNTLLMFSNNVFHSVEPNQSEKKRISIAFNYGDRVWDL